MDHIHARLAAARQELLDLGLRNPLINYRLLPARGLEIIDEQPAAIVHVLVAQERPMSFLPQPDNLPPEPDELGQPLTNGPVEQHTDNFLQTPYPTGVLQKRLLTSYYTAVSHIEEQGINVLYLALGMLHWRDTPSGARAYRAPLVLIPAALYREGANSRFHLKYTGADISDNLSLRLKLAADFNLALPPLPPTEIPDAAVYFEHVRQAVAAMPGWWVEDAAVALGFFSFSKSLMVHDLDPAYWPADSDPARHPLLQALLHPAGFTEPPAALRDDAFLDDHLPLAHSHQVVDADSSQMQAILDVNHGRNLVIQGPPGTGKSQTITNLMAEALGQGKTVLFVAEKLAALEVVKRRLDDIGLGDIALELHSHKSTKRAFLEELARTLKLGQPKTDGRFLALDTLTRLRTRLNTYSQAINAPIGSSGVPPYHAYGRALQLQAQLADVPYPPLSQFAMRDWSPEVYRARLGQVQALQVCLRPLGVPAQHPFWGSGSQEMAETAVADIRRLGQAVLAALDDLQRVVHDLAHHLHTAVPQSRHDLDKLLFDARQLLLAPNLYAVDVYADAWHAQAEPLLAALEAGQRISQCHAEYDEWLIPEAWAQDVMPIRQGLMAGPKRWRTLSGHYRRARQQLAGLCRRALPDSWEQQIGAIDAILDVQRLQPTLEGVASLLPQLFTVRWQNEATAWGDLLRVSRWLVDAHKEIQAGRYDPALLAYAARGVHGEWLRLAVSAVDQARSAYQTAVAHLFAYLQFDETRRLGSKQAFLNTSLPEQQDVLSRIHAGADRFPEMVVYNQVVHQLQADGLAGVAEVAHTWPHGAAHLTDLFNLAWFTSLVKKATISRQILSESDSAAQNTAVRQFQALDSHFLAANRVRLAQRHWQRLPHYAAGGQMGLLQAEITKQRQHKPIRTLMLEAGRAIQRIKPVFMMSPLSIAAFLPPDSITFDLVIFDEASQVRPVDALGAILRGRQVVVVGDSRQLPPTTFFERIVGQESRDAQGLAEGEDEDNHTSRAHLQMNAESILDLFCAQNAPQRMLRWHYRSRHESLIAISNRVFYERQLVIFPSPDAARQAVGLHLHVLPQTVYDRGHSRTNPAEAQAVAAAVMAHARAQLAASPLLTLGVVAFSVSQSEAIRDHLERLRRADPSAEPFFTTHTAEPFFVKNLENVQGDERDVIFISVGYGRAADGRVSLNFGPLNQTGGERRLNVLITRARQRCEIFTNLTAADIDADRVEARGVAVLQQYLHYAQTGHLPELAPEEGVLDAVSQAAPFEEVVATALRQHGYRLAHRVGEGSMRVDLAVWDDRRPGYYRVGLECDGDNYHLARAARDRDRIQAQVLAHLGWPVIRVWSHAWWQDPAGERARLVAEIEAAEGETAVSTSPPVVLERYAPLEAADTPRPVPDYQVAQVALPASKASFHHRYTAYVTFRQSVLHCLETVVAVESPVHVMEAMRRLWQAAGYKVLTATDSIAQRIVADVEANGRVLRQGDFLWVPQMAQPPVRNRANIPPISRKFEFIAPQEIDEAVFLTVYDAVDMPRDDVPLRVARLLGFRQVGGKVDTAVQASIDRLLVQGRLAQGRRRVSVRE